ncbi:putative pentatricopeptide repeat-containing protein At1g09680 [Papaver somniferum]|uniref:putative pentatricopeptide repeat-containing protein At1g09680 n=1 Tax=Papaver somniferum TaxID=3469 RepID=UPI000E6FFA32|nr:putative pentatricopeptide repeat-containing protein At1g09680 [Papaver somniferum]
MINGLCLDGGLKEAAKLFDSMVDRGLEPNEITYNVLIDGHCRNRKLGEAVQLFKKMKRNGLKPAIVDILLRELYRDGRMKTAQRFRNEMQTSGQSPDEVTYTTMMDGFCRNGKIKNPWRLQESQIVITCTASILIHGLCQAAQLEDARKVAFCRLLLCRIPCIYSMESTIRKKYNK